MRKRRSKKTAERARGNGIMMNLMSTKEYKEKNSVHFTCNFSAMRTYKTVFYSFNYFLFRFFLQNAFSFNKLKKRKRLKHVWFKEIVSAWK